MGDAGFFTFLLFLACVFGLISMSATADTVKERLIQGQFIYGYGVWPYVFLMVALFFAFFAGWFSQWA